MIARILIVLTILFTGTVSAQDIDRMIKNLKTDQELADTLFYYCGRYLMKGKTDSALYFIDKGIETARRMNDPARLGKFYVEKSNVVLMTDKKKTLEVLRQADPYMDYVKDSRTWEKYYLITANCYRHLLKNDFALEYYLRCEKLNNEYNPYRNWVVYLEMGEMFENAEAYEEAEKYLEKAYELTRSKAIRMDHGLMIEVLALFYQKRGKPEKFADVMKEYRAFIAARKKRAVDDPVHSMLFLDWKTMPLDERVSFLNKVKKTLLKNGDHINASYANSMISGFYKEANQYDKALEYMLENLELNRKVDDLYNLYVYSNAAYNLLKKMGKNTEAVEMADRIFLLKDSILKIQQRDIVLDLEAKYQTEKKEKEITILNARAQIDQKEIDLLNSQNTLNAIRLLREADQREALIRENNLKDSVLVQEELNNSLLLRENQLKNSELEKGQALTAAINRENEMKAIQLSKEKKFRWVLIAGAGLLLVSGFVILYFYDRQKKKSGLIQKQSNDMQVLLREIHHRVKNNLQVISSLLDLQSHTISDNQASEAVKEGKNRVQSMALIHQNLYSEDNLKGIRAKEYIDNLLKSLCDSYNISEEKIRLFSDIDDLNLDVDTMIPLGLILNEVVSNSLKYAFNNGKPGELHILLKEENGQLHLKVSDNGSGYPESLNTRDGKSFGLKMIRAFAQKLKAKLDIYNQDGAVVEMQISKYNLA